MMSLLPILTGIFYSSDMKTYTDCLTQKWGILLLSGFYKADIAIIESEVGKHGLVFDKIIQRNSWVALKYNEIERFFCKFEI